MGNTGSALQGLLWSDSVQLYLLLLPYPKPLCYGHAGPFAANLRLFVIFPSLLGPESYLTENNELSVTSPLCTPQPYLVLILGTEQI